MAGPGTDYPDGLSVYGIPLPAADGGKFSLGDVYWLDSSEGATGNDGSINSPFATLSAAIDSMSAGDVLYVKEGHTESLAAVVTISTAGISIIGMGSQHQYSFKSIFHLFFSNFVL